MLEIIRDPNTMFEYAVYGALEVTGGEGCQHQNLEEHLVEALGRLGIAPYAAQAWCNAMIASGFLCDNVLALSNEKADVGGV